MEQFTLVNKLRNRIKVFKPFQSNLEQAKAMMEIEYGCVYKRSSKPANEKVPYKMTETEGLLNPKINHLIIFTFRFQFIF